MKNIYIADMSHEYYVDIARYLITLGAKIKVIGASRYPIYWPKTLDGFIANTKPKITLWEDFNYPDRFIKILDPDYSILTPEVLEQLSYYEKMFLLSTDRLSFFPISQIDRCRLFYRFIGHLYKILINEKIDGVVFFGIPHGLFAIALFGLAKVLKLEVIYVDWAGVATDLAIIEKEIKPRRSYSKKQEELGLISNECYKNEVHDIVSKNIFEHSNLSTSKRNNRIKVLLRNIGGLLLRAPFGRYISPEFFLNGERRLRIACVLPLIKYYINVSQALNYYDRNSTLELPNRNSLVLFLHMQPEAVTMPQGGVFSDQLLVLDLILQALPDGMNVYVKEHPFMFHQFGQDRHERSVEFYAHMLRDPRVRFVNRSVNSNTLLKNAAIVASVNGTISWEAMRIGRPCIIFGWAWFSACKSCFVVDSVSAIHTAIVAASRKSTEDVIADVHTFLNIFEKRLIYAAPWRYALDYVEKGFCYEDSVARLARAIGISLDLPCSK